MYLQYHTYPLGLSVGFALLFQTEEEKIGSVLTLYQCPLVQGSAHSEA